MFSFKLLKSCVLNDSNLQMMEDLQKSFNELQNENKENHSSICDTLDNIDKTCNVINHEASKTCKIKTAQENCIQEKLEHDLQMMKQIVSEETEKVMSPRH